MAAIVLELTTPIVLGSTFMLLAEELYRWTKANQAQRPAIEANLAKILSRPFDLKVHRDASLGVLADTVIAFYGARRSLGLLRAAAPVSVPEQVGKQNPSAAEISAAVGSILNQGNGRSSGGGGQRPPDKDGTPLVIVATAMLLSKWMQLGGIGKKGESHHAESSKKDRAVPPMVFVPLPSSRKSKELGSDVQCEGNRCEGGTVNRTIHLPTAPVGKPTAVSSSDADRGAGRRQRADSDSSRGLPPGRVASSVRERNLFELEELRGVRPTLLLADSVFEKIGKLDKTVAAETVGAVVSRCGDPQIVRAIETRYRGIIKSGKIYYDAYTAPSNLLQRVNIRHEEYPAISLAISNALQAGKFDLAIQLFQKFDKPSVGLSASEISVTAANAVRATDPGLAEAITFWHPRRELMEGGVVQLLGTGKVKQALDLAKRFQMDEARLREVIDKSNVSRFVEVFIRQDKFDAAYDLLCSIGDSVSARERICNEAIRLLDTDLNAAYRFRRWVESRRSAEESFNSVLERLDKEIDERIVGALRGANYSRAMQIQKVLGMSDSHFRRLVGGHVTELEGMISPGGSNGSIYAQLMEISLQCHISVSRLVPRELLKNYIDTLRFPWQSNARHNAEVLFNMREDPRN